MPLRPNRPPLRVEERDGLTVVKLTTDELGEENAGAVGEELSALAGRAAYPRLLLDLAEVRYLTSTGLGLFVALHHRARAAGGALSLANVSGPVREVFEVTRLTQLLDVRPGAEAGHHLPTAIPPSLAS
jgi:anti-sigma B factor antagonist